MLPRAVTRPASKSGGAEPNWRCPMLDGLVALGRARRHAHRTNVRVGSAIRFRAVAINLPVSRHPLAQPVKAGLGEGVLAPAVVGDSIHVSPSLRHVAWHFDGVLSSRAAARRDRDSNAKHVFRRHSAVDSRTTESPFRWVRTEVPMVVMDSAAQTFQKFFRASRFARGLTHRFAAPR